MRKPVGITNLKRGTAETWVVVCDDGTAWRFNLGTDRWEQLASIPGSQADSGNRPVGP